MQAAEARTLVVEGATKKTIRDNAPLIAIWALVALIIVIGVLFSPTFRSPANIFNALRQSIFLGFVSIGQTFAIIAGGIDLSVGSIVKLVVLVSAGVMQGNAALTIPVILLCLALGSFIGLVNGLVVTRLGVAPFIATLGMYIIIRGFAFGYTTTPVGSISREMRQVYNMQIGPVPIPVMAFFVFLIVAFLVLTRTTFGRHLYAVGGNEVVSRLSGLRVDWLRTSVFVVSGFLAAVAGLFMVSRMGVGDPNVGDGLELDSIAAVVLGGTSLLGGRGTLIGTLAGVLLLAFVNNVFNLLSVSTWYQGLIKGLIILLAVAIYKQKH